MGSNLSGLAQLFTFLSFGRYNSTPPTIGDGTTSEVQLDQQGRLRVTSMPEQTTKTKLSWMGVSTGTIKTTAGKLWSIQGASGAAANVTKYFQLFDANTALTNGATVPLISIPISGGCNFSNSFETSEGLAGLPFSNGMLWAVSGSQFVFTTDSTQFSVLAFFE